MLSHLPRLAQRGRAVYFLLRCFHSTPPLENKGGREPSGKSRPAPKAAAGKGKGGGGGSAAAAAASPVDLDAGEESEGEASAKDKSLSGSLARQVAYARRELERIRGSTPSAGMLDGVVVPAYGESKALQELAQVVLRGPSTLVVSPFDASLAGAISEAIVAADLGLNPVDEGSGTLRVPIPKASKETREAAVKLVSRIAEQAKVRVRRVRAGALGDLKKQAGLPEDELRVAQEAVEKQAAAATAEVAKMAEAKRVQLEKM
jgi:ribosome recycling factor